MQIDEDSVSAQNWNPPFQLTVGTSVIPLTTTIIHAYRGIHLKADDSNTNVIYIGQSTTTGYPLAKGEDIFLPLDDPRFVYLVAGASSQKLYVMIF